ncbi:uncharacterized protein LOC135116420 [Scylla paramamosain]|uniref:uncharacterized protein LOC135116420 n=1 Tax=Scylla paramamosain TaxID=85552 RepID=UPI003083A3CB
MNHKKFLHESFKTGGGPPPKPVTDDFLAVATDALSEELQFADNQLDSLVPIVIREEEVEIIDDDMLFACTIAAGPSTTPAAGPATAPAAGPATAPAARPVTAPPPGPATAPAAGPATAPPPGPATAPAARPATAPPPGPATAPPPGPASAPPTVTATAPAMAPATPPAGPATAPGGTSQTEPSTRRGRKRPLHSEREECFCSIREGAETLNDDLKVSLQNFSALCEKLGNQAELAANAFAQALQTSTNAFVQTMHNVDSTMEQVMTAPGGTSQTGPSTRRGRKRPLGSEREECFRSIREGAETLNDDLKVSLQNFSALCEKLGNQAELAANAFAQALQTSINAFVQTMHNVDSSMEQIRKYYSPASGRPSSL